MDVRDAKLIHARYAYSVRIGTDAEHIYFYDTPMAVKEELKAMRGARWLGFDEKNPQKCWRVDNCRRNRFNLDYMEGKKPFARYTRPLLEAVQELGIMLPPKRMMNTGVEATVYSHQNMMTYHMLVRRQCVISGEMGVGKTLAVFRAIEHSGVQLCWYVAPKSALSSVKLDAKKWRFSCNVIYMTYDEMKKRLTEWKPGDKSPPMVIFDESSRLKNMSAQRTQAALYLAENMRQEHGDKAYIILMTGSPSPKSPVDWYAQCIASGTPVLTARGPVAIENVQVEHVFNDGIQQECNSGAVSKGMKQVFRLETDEGYTVEATSDHRFMTEFGWIELNKCLPGTKLKIHNQARADWQGKGSFGEGYLIGQMVGDGYKGVICVWPQDYDAVPMIRLMCPGRAMGSFSEKRYSLESIELVRLADYFQMDGAKNISFEGTSREFIKGYLSALFDCDATIEKGRARIQLAQVDRKRLIKVQELLSYFGIMSKIALANKARIGTIEGREIQCQDTYTLIVSGIHAQNFATRIGFRYKRKREAEKELLTIKSQMSQTFFATVKEISPAGEKEVYDISVPETNAFSAAGFYVHNCEIACPGFIKEGDVKKFENRLAINEKQGDFTGVSYFKRIAWRDGNPNTCRCGRKREDTVHVQKIDGPYHEFAIIDNEVANLYKRISGLVYVLFKKDCLELPEKQYRRIKLKPSMDLMRAARMIMAKAPNVITAMTLCREISDGFQYVDELVADDLCLACDGQCYITKPDGTQEPCIGCSATGSKRKMVRKVVEVPSPKLDALTDLLEENEDYGRLVVYAGFMGSIDRICKHVERQGWKYIRVDGRGWTNNMSAHWNDIRCLEEFQKLSDNPEEKIVFVGHPGSAGMGLTLTASSMIVYVSNDFNGESRIQSEDRIHRPGADENRGCTIVDLVLLPTDQKLLDNLARKRELQSISLGELSQAIDNYQFTHGDDA